MEQDLDLGSKDGTDSSLVQHQSEIKVTNLEQTNLTKIQVVPTFLCTQAAAAELSPVSIAIRMPSFCCHVRSQKNYTACNEHRKKDCNINWKLRDLEVYSTIEHICANKQIVPLV